MLPLSVREFLKSCRGAYPGAPSIPFTPGYDIVGMVDKLGLWVSSLSEGQMVAALRPHFGGNAEFVCVPEKWLVPVPAGVDPAEVVSVVLNYLTAHRLLHRSAQVPTAYGYVAVCKL